ncbi:unnamed protein product [Pylaiella littoralis]
MRHRCSPSASCIVVGLLVDQGCRARGFAAPPSLGSKLRATPPPFSLLSFSTFVPREQPNKTSAWRRASSLTCINSRRLSRTACAAAAKSSTDLTLDPSPSSPSRRETSGPSDAAEPPVVPLEAAAIGDEVVQEEDEEGTWAEDFQAVEMLTKGAGAVGAGVKSVALASTPLKLKPDGRIVMNADGLLNLCILVFTGLWAVHSVVTVDAGSWRGWTLQETLMRLPWDNWDSYEVGLVEHPIITKTAINVGIYIIGDWLSQVNWGREEDVELWEFDLMRTLRSGFIGAIFGPVVHYYYNFSDWVLPPDILTNRPLKIIMDQSIYFCSKCTVYMSLVCLLRGASWEETKETLDTRLKGVITTGWRFWPFVHLFTYFLIPPRHRVLWVNSVDLLWNSILSSMTSGKTDEEDPGAGEDEGGEGQEELAFGSVDGTAVSSAPAAAAAAKE